jgi:hypothetical protein
VGALKNDSSFLTLFTCAKNYSSKDPTSNPTHAWDILFSAQLTLTDAGVPVAVTE